MTTCSEKELLIRFTVCVVLNLYQFVCMLLSFFFFFFLSEIWDSILLVPDHCRSFFTFRHKLKCEIHKHLI